MTRRLLSTSSGSVRIAHAPSAAIHAIAGNPIGTPAARRKARMKSRYGSGFGAAMFTAPDSDSCCMIQYSAPTKSRS